MPLILQIGVRSEMLQDIQWMSLQRQTFLQLSIQKWLPGEALPQHLVLIQKTLRITLPGRDYKNKLIRQ